ncbi:MAG: site-specific integrase [Planctomycetales bacterium]|nr:site-specific integrase [Planctomycetales bacterium]
MRLLDESGRPIRGKECRNLAELALARVKAAGAWRPVADLACADTWQVAKVCSRYIAHCEHRAANGRVSLEYRNEVNRLLNAFCAYCGGLAVAELRKGHVEHWVESQATWRSPATRSNAITIVLAAFNYAHEQFDVANPLRGLKKPPPRPRLHSFSPEDEQAMYAATDQPYRDFLFAAVHTGLRPFCELARLRRQDVFETARGMMWRVDSSKTGKTRRIPVRSEVAELTRRWLSTIPANSATVFRNLQGRPWKKVTGGCRFRTIRRRLDWEADPVRQGFSTYTCRHTFAHRMLAGYWNGGVGCTIEVLAELMGDTPSVAFNHYGKMWGQHYQDPLWAAIGAG